MKELREYGKPADSGRGRDAGEPTKVFHSSRADDIFWQSTRRHLHQYDRSRLRLKRADQGDRTILPMQLSRPITKRRLVGGISLLRCNPSQIVRRPQAGSESRTCRKKTKNILRRARRAARRRLRETKKIDTAGKRKQDPLARRSCSIEVSDSSSTSRKRPSNASPAHRPINILRSIRHPYKRSCLRISLLCRPTCHDKQSDLVRRAQSRASRPCRPMLSRRSNSAYRQALSSRRYSSSCRLRRAHRHSSPGLAIVPDPAKRTSTGPLIASRRLLRRCMNA